MLLYDIDMKNKILHTGIAAIALFFVGCSHMTPEVVEFDSSYKPKEPNKIDRDKVQKPPLDLLTQYVVFKNNDQKIRISYELAEDGNLIASPIEDVNVVIGTSIKIAEPFKVKVVNMTNESHPKTFQSVVNGEVKLLPSDMFTLSANEVTFNPKDSDQKISIKIDTEKAKTLDRAFTYVVPLVLEVPKEGEVKVHNFFLLSVNLEIISIEAGQNVKYINKWSTEKLTRIPAGELKAISDYKPEFLQRITDGNNSRSGQNWWVPSTGNDPQTLTIKFPRQKVKGVILKGNYETKHIKQINVSVSANGGSSFVDQGTAVNPNAGAFNGADMFIVFDKPQDIDAVKFSKFKGNLDFVNIVEVEVYY